MQQRKIPVRRCVGCNAQKPKRELVRVVRSPDGDVSVDLTGKKAGRGAGKNQPKAEPARPENQKPARPAAPAAQSAPAERSRSQAGRVPPAKSPAAGQTPMRPPSRPGRAPRDSRSDDPGLVLISRRPPQQKFSSFEEYMAAHGGATAPIEDHSEDYE